MGVRHVLEQRRRRVEAHGLKGNDVEKRTQETGAGRCRCETGDQDLGDGIREMDDRILMCCGMAKKPKILTR